jgi:serine/threonine protein kinase
MATVCNRQSDYIMDDQEKLAARIREITGWTTSGRTTVITDTTDWLRIVRGNIIRLSGKDFLVKGTEYERRFGIDDQPKYWVFNAYELETGDRKIIKTVFHEDFLVHIGFLKIRCFRSPEKEADVLELVRGDSRFMQGYTILDEKKNNVRIIDHIPGKSIFHYIFNISKNHEQYFHEDLPVILWKLVDSIEAILLLHKNNFCHGDIRNDHIIIDTETGQYRWIDFDLNQNVSDFDIWSIGNILNYAVGKGITAFMNVMRDPDVPKELKDNLHPEDASGFYEYRLMNLKKLYRYIPDRLDRILLHFTIRPREFYASIEQFYNDYREMLVKEFPEGEKLIN